MKKPTLLFFVFGIILIFIVYRNYWFPEKLYFEENKKIETISKNTNTSAHNKRHEFALRNLNPFVKSFNYDPTPFQLTNSHKENPFQLLGTQSEIGRIVNQNGKTILQSDENITIIGLEFNPNRNYGLITCGDGISFLIDTKFYKKTKLPERPDADNTFHFSWYWLNDNTLLGVTGTIANKNHEHTDACLEPKVEKNIFCIYDAASNSLKQLDLPQEIEQNEISVTEVIADGHIKISIFNEEKSEEKSVWYYLDVKK